LFLSFSRRLLAVHFYLISIVQRMYTSRAWHTEHEVKCYITAMYLLFRAHTEGRWWLHT